MRSIKLVALSLSILMLAGCATLGLKRTPQRQNQKLPEYDASIDGKVYYNAWVSCEGNLDKCVDAYDGVVQ